MKYKTTICFIILLSVICGCSKPEPPVVKTPPVTKNPAAKKYILDVPAVTSETEYVEADSRAMAPVRVSDTDTGLPITHATVCARWRSGDGPKMSLGKHMEDGVYLVPTNGIKGRVYVGAFAEGYQANDFGNPSFPLDISLIKGDTIEISGSIHHANGNPVTNGIINLRVSAANPVESQWRLLSPCYGIPDDKGNFILPHVSAGIDNVFVIYTSLNNEMVVFKDHVFSTTDGDVHLTLQLPLELTIKGHVLFSSGSAVSGAWVWTERMTGEAPDAWNKKLAEKRVAVNGVTVQTGAEGYFELTLLKVMDRYVIKAFHPLYEVVYTGPYSDNSLPPDPIEIIIKDEGARLYGQLSTIGGEPVTNCEVHYIVVLSSGHGKLNTIHLDIDEDGNYISGIVPPGSYDLVFTAPGYYQQRKAAVIQENATEQCDVEFLSFCILTGIVYDAETRQPIPGVTLVKKGWTGEKKQEFSKLTDQNGNFWIKSGNSPLNIEFKHPEYAPILYNFTKSSYDDYDSVEKIKKNICTEIILSKRGSIRVFGQANDGTPLDDYGVKLEIGTYKNIPRGNYSNFSNYQRAKLIEGEALLTNVPVMISPVYVKICSKNYSRTFVKSELITVAAGEETTVTLTLPPTGSLILSFLHPIEKDVLEIIGIKAGNGDFSSSYKRSFSTHDFIRKNQQMILDGILTNEYKITIKNTTALSLETNVLITANNTTEVVIDNSTNVMGAIRGTVTTHDGGVTRCLLRVSDHSSGKQTAEGRIEYNNAFSIGGLSRDRLYDLTINSYEGSFTNIIISGLTPGGPALDIKLPEAYRITGNVIDSDGNPLKARIGIPSAREYGPGEFTIYPVFPGTYTLCINAPEYPMVIRKVTVYDRSVDVGDVVINDKGIELSGRVITLENKPVANAKVSVYNNEVFAYFNAITDDNGYFCAKNLSRKIAFTVSVRHNDTRGTHETEPLSSDTDIGDIVLNSQKD